MSNIYVWISFIEIDTQLSKKLYWFAIRLLKVNINGVVNTYSRQTFILYTDIYYVKLMSVHLKDVVTWKILKWLQRHFIWIVFEADLKKEIYEWTINTSEYINKYLNIICK